MKIAKVCKAVCWITRKIYRHIEQEQGQKFSVKNKYFFRTLRATIKFPLKASQLGRRSRL